MKQVLGIYQQVPMLDYGVTLSLRVNPTTNQWQAYHDLFAESGKADNERNMDVIAKGLHAFWHDNTEPVNLSTPSDIKAFLMDENTPTELYTWLINTPIKHISQRTDNLRKNEITPSSNGD